MAWRNLVKPLSTADVAGTVVSQRFRHPTNRVILAGVHIGMAFYNDPAFADVKMELRADRNGSPGKLIATSTTRYTKAELLLVEDHALKFAGFLFDEVTLQANEWYHLVLVPSTYTGVDASFIAWRYSYPDPQYVIATENDAAAAARHHLDFSIFGAKLELSE